MRGNIACVSKLSPEDASILALAAEHPAMSEDMFNRLLDHTTSLRVKRILRGLRSERSHRDPKVRSAVKGLRVWADRNRLVHASPRPKKKRQ
jgi:hypothetical protein